MTTEHLDARPLLASALVTAIDHVGVAVPDLDKAVAWYHDFLGMIVVHEEVNADQGVREAMLVVRGAPAGSSQIQLMAPLDDTCTIAKFLDKRGPGIQQLACRALRRAAARDGELPNQLHPSQGRRWRAGGTCGAGPALGLRTTCGWVGDWPG